MEILSVLTAWGSQPGLRQALAEDEAGLPYRVESVEILDAKDPVYFRIRAFPVELFDETVIYQTRLDKSSRLESLILRGETGASCIYSIV